jgi:hypothetical protein
VNITWIELGEGGIRLGVEGGDDPLIADENPLDVSAGDLMKRQHLIEDKLFACGQVRASAWGAVLIPDANVEVHPCFMRNVVRVFPPPF